MSRAKNSADCKTVSLFLEILYATRELSIPNPNFHARSRSFSGHVQPDSCAKIRTVLQSKNSGTISSFSIVLGEIRSFPYDLYITKQLFASGSWIFTSLRRNTTVPDFYKFHCISINHSTREVEKKILTIFKRVNLFKLSVGSAHHPWLTYLGPRSWPWCPLQRKAENHRRKASSRWFESPTSCWTKMNPKRNPVV